MNPLRRFHATVLSGVYRWPSENYRVLVGRIGESRRVAVSAPCGSYYADPFLYRHGAEPLWLFVEEFRYLKNRARLCALPLGKDLRAAGPAQPLTLPADLHLSFPLVFNYQGNPLLLPETGARRTIELHACARWPDRWRPLRVLLTGIDAVDTTPLFHDGRWWLFTSVRRDGDRGGRRSLGIFFADDLLSASWYPHPSNASRLYADSPYSWGRGAGNFVRSDDGAWYRPIQASVRYYGEASAWMRVEELTPTTCRESLCEGPPSLGALAREVSPHHIATCDGIVACDVRDRVSWRQHVPLLRRQALVPDARALAAIRLSVA